jgi:hypothetical protein
MKTEMIIKIIRGIFKISSNIEIKKDSKMPEENNENVQPKKTTIINSNTIVQFTFKGFISTILTILGIFFGFYKLVIQPDIQQTAEHQKEFYLQQKEYMDKEFEDVKNAIQINTRAIEATNDRFRDLNRSVEEISNSGGSFGSTTSEIINPNENDIDVDALATIQD